MQEEVVRIGPGAGPLIQNECRLESASANTAIYQDAQQKCPQDDDADRIDGRRALPAWRAQERRQSLPHFRCVIGAMNTQ